MLVFRILGALSGDVNCTELLEVGPRTVQSPSPGQVPRFPTGGPQSYSYLLWPRFSDSMAFLDLPKSHSRGYAALSDDTP